MSDPPRPFDPLAPTWPSSNTALAQPPRDGALIAACVGGSIVALLPDRARMLARVLTAIPAVALVGGFLGLLVWTGGSHWWIYYHLAKGGLVKVGLVGAGATGIARFSSRLVAWQMRRLAAFHRSVASLRAAHEGEFVRIEGVVQGGAAFAAAVSGAAAVLAHYEIRTGSRVHHQIRGVDFLLAIEGGEAVRITVAESFFDMKTGGAIEEPADPGVVRRAPDEGSTRVSYREARIAPGDRVEAMGVLVREPDPALASGPARTPPLRLVLRGSARIPLLLRKV
jgi:hypothetical protein